MSFLEEEGHRQVQPRFLDLSGLKLQSREEIQNVVCKVLEMRLRSDKLNEDDLENILCCQSSAPHSKYPFLDPVPESMRDVDLKELIQVDIDWKMLTLARPNTKRELEIFTRIVELNKLTLRSVTYEKTHVPNRMDVLDKITAEDNLSQEPNADEFTYEFFSLRLGIEDQPPPADDINKKPIEVSKPKLKPKSDSVVTENPTPETPQNTTTPLSAKGKKKRDKPKGKRKRKRTIKRTFKRLKNGKVVYKIYRKKRKRYVVGKDGKKIRLKVVKLKPKVTANKMEKSASSSSSLKENVKESKVIDPEMRSLTAKSKNAEIFRRVPFKVSANGSLSRVVRNQRGLKTRKSGDPNLEKKTVPKRKVKGPKRTSVKTVIGKSAHEILTPAKQSNSDDKQNEKSGKDNCKSHLDKKS